MSTKDPLLLSQPSDAHKELFTRFSQECNGFPTSAVVDAAANVIINALRQSHTTRASAERSFDELFGKMKSILVDHYDVLGRKRGVFPYNQTIEVPLIKIRR